MENLGANLAEAVNTAHLDYFANKKNVTSCSQLDLGLYKCGENHVKLQKKTMKKMEAEVKRKYCDFCNYFSNKNSNVVRHKATVHASNQKAKKFVCNICNRTFSYKCTLKTHFKIHLHSKCTLPEKSNFICIECNTYFSSQQNLKRHRQTLHEGLISYDCVICKQNFSTKTMWKVHASTKH